MGEDISDQTQPSTTQMRATSVDLSGLLSILGSHLYSTPAVVLRELVQNAHDSITRRRLAEGDWDGGEILVTARPQSGELIVEDDGAGMTRDELHAHLATVGAGATGPARGADSSDALIGMFGIGFLSTFSVARDVTVDTASLSTPDESWRYSSSGGERYALAPAPPRGAGTTVTVALDAEHAELADPALVRELMTSYCRLLDVPLRLDGDDEPVNAVAPPWRDGESEHPVQARRRRLAFAEAFDRGFAPLVTLEVTALDDSDAAGLLWIHDARSYSTSDNRRLAVYVRGMLVDDEARDLLPRWAGFVSGVIESAKLSPTASREDIRRDETYEAVAAALREALVAGLSRLPKEQPEAWRRVLTRHNEALTGAAIVDQRLFELLADDLLIPSSDGDLPAREIARRGDGRLHVGLARGGFEEMLFRALGVAIADGTRYAVLPFMRRWCEHAGVALVEIGTQAGDRAIFRSAQIGEPERARLAGDFGRDGWELLPARFEPAALPFVLVPDHEAELKRRLEADDADARIASAALRLARTHTAKIDGRVRARLYVNLDSPAIEALLAARAQAPATRRAVAVLRSLLAVLAAGSGADGAAGELPAAFEEAGQVVVELLESEGD